MSTINCKNIIKKYGDIQVIHGFDLDVADEEFIVFLGPSGCGKSTIMRMIAGLEEITSGSLHIADKEVTHASAGERGVAMVFQNYALYPHMNVYKNIAFGLRRQNLAKEEIDKRINNVVEMLKLKPYLKRKPAQMSGGQQQRVAIARAIVKTPNVFLFDEPLSNLDAKLRHQLRVEIAQLHRQLKTTTIFVTHDQLEAMTLADRIVLMNEGVAEQIGTPKEIYNRPKTKFVADFIGTPAMNFIDGSARAENGSVTIRTGLGELIVEGNGFADDLNEDVSVGVRPQHIMASTNTGDKNVFTGKVTFIEYLGSETLLTVYSNGSSLNVLVDNTTEISEGDSFTFSISVSNLHLFSSDTGLRLNEDD